MRSVIKIISFTLVLSIIFAVLVFPVSASAAVNYELALSIFDALASGDSGLDTFLEQFLVDDFNSCSGCPNASDGIHVWQFSQWHAYYPGIGNYRCMLCGLDYSDYASTAYNNHVAEMPGTNYTSAGGLIWQVTWSDVTSLSVFKRWDSYTGNNFADSISCPVSVLSSYSLSSSSYICPEFQICDNTYARYYHLDSESLAAQQGIYGFKLLEFTAPISGTYSRVSSPFVLGTLLTHIGDTISYSSYYSASSSFSSYSAGATVSTSNYYSRQGPYSCTYVDISLYLPVYQITPLASDTTTTNYYVNSSRPTYNITYNLATVTQAGDYTVINNVYENQTIINEGDNIYTDIKTGNEYEIEGWEYDYTNRKYTCNLVDGSLLEVTFGDAYVTVELDGEVEYYYYATEDDSAAGCSHDYDLAESVAATCTEDGYNVYVCTLCNHSYQDQTFAIGHNYQFLWTVLDTYEVDTSTLVCPGCNGTDITCTQVDKTENFTCVCNSADCAQTWTVVGSTIAGYDLYQCMNCQEFYNDYTHEGVDRSDAGYWSWLQTWLQNFKTWLGEKLDALVSGSDSESSAGDGKDVSVDLGDTDKENEFKNFFTGFTTFIGLDDVVLDFDVNYTDEDGSEQNTSLKGIIGKFAFVKDIWKIGQALIAVVSEDAAYAYEFDPTIGNEATTDTGTEAATVSVEEEADTLLSSGSGAPSLPLNLGAAQSVYGFNYGGEVEALSLEWYTPYKETVDKLVGGFLWLFFMWKLFQRAPGIISGASMDSSKVEDVKSGTKGKRR